MKLLLDENLSRRIVPAILDTYPDSTQIALLGMESADDLEVWEYAKQHNYLLVTQDADFSDMSAVKGHPPKVIWLKCGNQPKKRIIEILLSVQDDICRFNTEPGLSCLEIYG